MMNKKDELPKTIGQLLKKVHVTRSTELERVITQKELAEWFGIDYPLFNHYYNDVRAPTDEINLIKLADKLGPQVYDVLGLARPDHRLAEIRAAYDAIPEQDRDELVAWVRKFLNERGYNAF